MIVHPLSELAPNYHITFICVGGLRYSALQSQKAVSAYL